MGTCGQPGYVFRDFCLKQGIDFIIFCLHQGIFLNSFVIANGLNKKEFRYLLLSYTGYGFGLNVLNRVRIWGAGPHLPTQGYIEYPPRGGGMWPLLAFLTLFLLLLFLLFFTRLLSSTSPTKKIPKVTCSRRSSVFLFAHFPCSSESSKNKQEPHRKETRRMRRFSGWTLLRAQLIVYICLEKTAYLDNGWKWSH